MIHGLIRKIVTFKLNLKIISLLIGFSIWYGLIHIVPAHYTFDVPICFDDEIENVHCSSERVSITLASSKAHFYVLDKNSLAFHISKNELHDGKNILCIHAEKLLLPLSFKLIDCCPSTITITTSMDKKLYV